MFSSKCSILCCLVIFALVIGFSLAASPIWKDCGDIKSVIHVKKLELSPVPVHDNETINAQVLVDKDISDAVASVEIQKRVLGFWIE